jgi:hypothetical protein
VAREHIIYGVNDGTVMTLEPLRRPSQAIVRPMSRKDIFYGGSVVHLAEDLVRSSLQTFLTLTFLTLSIMQESTMPQPLVMPRYRHSVISIPRGLNRMAMPRGSIVASHLSIRKEAIGDAQKYVRLQNTRQ